VAAFVYVLLSRAKPKRTYVGWTLDLDRRLEQHNDGSGAKTTRGGAWTLIYAERYRTRNAAMRREVFLKRDRDFRKLLRER
jgi:putative endonuclease